MLKFQAHKGVSTENPENTIRAYMAAIEQGYHTIEMDVSVTKDMTLLCSTTAPFPAAEDALTAAL